MVKLSEIAADVFVGLTLSRREARGGGGEECPILSVGDVDQDGTVAPVAQLPRRQLEVLADDERYRVRPGDVLLSARGTQMKVGWVRDESRGAVASSTLIVVRPGRTMCPEALLSALLSPYGQQQIQARVRPSTSTLVLNVQDAVTIEVPVPPKKVQDQIRRLIVLGEEHYRVTLELALARRDLGLAVSQQLLFGTSATSTGEEA